MDFNNDDMLRSYLKSESKRLGISIKNTYNTFFSRILLERISNTSYEKLYVKGSFSNLCHLNYLSRPITDIDIVSTEYHNEPILTLYKAMYDSNDDLVYELNTLPKTTKTGIIKLSLTANYGKIKHPISVDFQELSKTIYEKNLMEVLPVFKNDNLFKIYTPSIEEHLAEKLCIIVESNDKNKLNTRVKDFYDIYNLSNEAYDEDKLSLFFEKMLYDRNKIDLDDININFIDKDYIKKHLTLWNDMSAKYEFQNKNIEFVDAVLNAKKMLDKEIELLKR